MTGKCRWRRRKDARPGELIDAALELFVERGFAASKLDDVARHAGVSKGTVYLYFENKEALLRAAVREVLLPHIDDAEKKVQLYSGSAATLMRQLAQHWWRSVVDTRLSGISKLMVAEAANFPELAEFYVDNVVRRGRQLVTRILERGVARGEFVPMDAEYVARVGLAPIVFAAIFQHSLAPFDDPNYDPQKYIDVHLETFLRGIAASPDDVSEPISRPM